ncbi:Uncharacterised protein [Bacillus cereus]|nr:Uncharacterised protein [Bacillus cereus]
MLKMTGRIFIIIVTVIAMVYSYRTTVDLIDKILITTNIYCIGAFILVVTFYVEILYDEKNNSNK